MINGIKLNEKNITNFQKRLRLMELSGVKLTPKQKKKLLNESVSMVEIPKNRTQVVPKKPQQEPYEDELDLDLDEILREMGYYEESDDLRDDFTDDVEDDDTISNMSREELKTMIQGIVLDTMDEEYDLNEIIENLTKNY
jgi:hypothetical protein|tara:strand:- start:4 stop:423 length:420 start_codon:yes stop_codon:yes gene_type:complete